MQTRLGVFFLLFLARAHAWVMPSPARGSMWAMPSPGRGRTWAVSPLMRRAAGAPPPRCCAAPTEEDGWTELAKLGCACATDADRELLIVRTVSSWPASERRDNNKKFSAALSALAHAIQTTAQAAHERGEDTSKAQAELQTIVNMSVQSALLVKRLNGEKLSGFTVRPDGRIT